MHPTDSRPRALRPILSALGFDRRAEVVRMESGWSNQVVRVRLGDAGCVARIARRQPGTARRRSEARVWALASAAGIAPPLLHLAPTTGVLVTHDVRASDLDLASGSPDNPALEAIGALAARFHGLPAPAQPVTDPRIRIRLELKRAEASGASIDALVVRLAQSMPDLSADVLAHGDLIAANVLLGARPWLVDFETAGRGDADFDLVAFSRTLNLDADGTAALFQGAQRALPSHERLRALASLFELREHAWALARIAEGRTEAAIAEQRDQSLAALRDLNRGD